MIYLISNGIRKGIVFEVSGIKIKDIVIDFRRIEEQLNSRN